MPPDLKTVSVVLTSGSVRDPDGRKDVFLKTIQSFLKFNTHPIEKFIITEDSPCAVSLDHIMALLTKNRLIEEVILIDDGKNRGQVYRIDQGYSLVGSDFIFRCEEDWEFVKSGFIEASLGVLKDDSIFSVQLHGYKEYISPTRGNQGWSVIDAPHLNYPNPVEPFMILNPTEYNTSPYKYPFFVADEQKFKKIFKPWNNTFVGFSFNPALKRLKDYQAIQSYANLIKKTDLQYFIDKHKGTAFNFLKPIGQEVEVVAGKYYSDKGFDFAVTKEKYINHIGVDRGVNAQPLHS